MPTAGLRLLQNNKALKHCRRNVRCGGSLRLLQNNKALKHSFHFSASLRCLRLLQNNKALKQASIPNCKGLRFKTITK